MERSNGAGFYHLVYLLYWCKSTNTDTCGAAVIDAEWPNWVHGHYAGNPAQAWYASHMPRPTPRQRPSSNRTAHTKTKKCILPNLCNFFFVRYGTTNFQTQTGLKNDGTNRWGENSIMWDDWLVMCGQNKKADAVFLGNGVSTGISRWSSTLVPLIRGFVVFQYH